MILRTSNDGLRFYTFKHRIDYPWYSIVEFVENVCKRSELSTDFCNSIFK